MHPCQPIRGLQTASLPCGADEFIHDKVQQLLRGAEVAIRIEELVDVAFQRGAAGTQTNSIEERSVQVGPTLT